MIKFSQQVFPADISYGMAGGPEYSTDVIVAKSGAEQRNINWGRPKYRYNVAYGVRTKEQLDKLICFFRSHKGKAIGLRFKDWVDYKARNQRLRELDGSNFQLVKYYEQDMRIITKPVKDSVVIRLNGKKFTDYIIDYDSGIVTLGKEIKGDLRADFEFDVPVRFDTDRLVSTIESYGVYSWQEIPLLEVIDPLHKPTSAGNSSVDSLLESSRILKYAAVLRSESSSNSLAEAASARGLL
jgi:uncharacterized protein (TIGR02217 family)